MQDYAVLAIPSPGLPPPINMPHRVPGSPAVTALNLPQPDKKRDLGKTRKLPGLECRGDILGGVPWKPSAPRAAWLLLLQQPQDDGLALPASSVPSVVVLRAPCVGL